MAGLPAVYVYPSTDLKLPACQDWKIKGGMSSTGQVMYDNPGQYKSIPANATVSRNNYYTVYTWKHEPPGRQMFWGTFSVSVPDGFTAVEGSLSYPTYLAAKNC